jgi:hypothetical protein
LYYSLKIERDVLIGTLTQMLPSRIAYPKPPEDDQACLGGIDVLSRWLSLDKPTLLAMPVKTKSPPAFLRSISEDLRDIIAVHQITEELPAVCDFVLRSALRIKQRPALVLVRPLRSLQAGNVAHIDHFRIPTHDTMSNGAFRRWLDRAWTKIGMKAELGELKSRILIPKYIEPEVLRAILMAEHEADREEKYNAEVDRRAEEQEERETAAAKAATSPTTSEYNYEQEVEEEERIDFRTEL